MDKSIIDELKNLSQEDGIRLLLDWMSDKYMSKMLIEKIIDNYKKSSSIDYLKLYIDTLQKNYPISTVSKNFDKSTVIRRCDVPRELKGEKIEKFWESLEKSYMLDGRKEKVVLSRRGYYWVFATKTLAAYIASQLYEFKVVTPYASIEQVANYNPQSLQKLLTKSPFPRGADVVDKVVSLCI